MEAIVKMTDGKTYTITGDTVDGLQQYFQNFREGLSATAPLGWIGVNGYMLNGHYVVSIEFKD